VQYDDSGLRQEGAGRIVEIGVEGLSSAPAAVLTFRVLSDLRVQKKLPETLAGVDAVVFAVRHDAYMNLTPDKIIKMTGKPAAIVDCFGILDDEKIRRYFELGCEVKGLGRGHVKRIKDAVRNK
jgi:hypothetical protein